MADKDYDEAEKLFKSLGNYDDSIEFLKDILKTKHDWYLSRDMAENYFLKEEYDESLKWAAKGILARDGKLENKVKLFSLVGDILEIKGFEDEAIMNKYMYYVIRNAKEWPIDDELKDLGEIQPFPQKGKMFVGHAIYIYNGKR